MEKYEYKTILFERKNNKGKINPDDVLNKLGSEGWELATSFVPQTPSGLNEVYLTLKRKINE